MDRFTKYLKDLGRTIWSVLKSLLKAVLLSVIFLMISIPFLKDASNLPFEESVRVGEDNLIKIGLIYLLLALVTILYLERKKASRAISSFLIGFFLLGVLVYSLLLDHSRNFQLSDGERVANEERDQRLVLPEATGERKVSYQWKYKGKDYSLDKVLYSSYYQFYTSLPTTLPDNGQSEIDIRSEGNLLFMRAAENDSTLRDLTQDLKNLAESNGLSEDQLVEFAASFVQTIPYDQEKLDRRTVGFDEHTEKITYPYEVLFQSKGVCQDKSYLAYQILKELGYGVAIFLFADPKDNHMAVGVKCPFEYSNYESGYCFLESTNPGNKIGTIPDLIPQSRIARSDIEINISTDANSEPSSQPLGNVEILNQIDGKEYKGILTTIAIQKELASLKRIINSQQADLNSREKQLGAMEEELEDKEKKLKKLEKEGDYDDYKDYYDKYEDAYSDYKKALKAYNEVNRARNANIDKYNKMNFSFYQ